MKRSYLVVTTLVVLLLASVGVALLWHNQSADSTKSPEGQIITASPYMELHDIPAGGSTPIVEGPAFSSTGTMFFVSVFGDSAGNKVFEADLEAKRVTPIHADDDSTFASLAIHHDGTLFLADLGLGRQTGKIVSMSPDGSQMRTVLDQYQGEPIHPDDLVFDSAGNLYFNDMTGTVSEPTGRVLRMSTNGDVSLVADKLASPNGLAFDPTGTTLWVSEHTANRILTIGIDENGSVDNGSLPNSGMAVMTHLSGGEVDSLTTDAQGNVYAAMYKNGRVEVVDKTGNPFATILPGDLRGDYPNTTHVVIRPQTHEGYILAAGPEKVSLLSFEAPALGSQPYSHTE